MIGKVIDRKAQKKKKEERSLKSRKEVLKSRLSIA